MSVTPKRRKKLEESVRLQLAAAVRQSLDGTELLMKEVWEGVDTDEEDAVVMAELLRIAIWLERLEGER